ncbi:ribonuclease H-like domain-containing protein [Tanacetum coccineum]
MFNKPSFDKINFVKSTEQVKSLRKISVYKNRQNTPSPRGNKRNWNQQMSQKLGIDFEMFNKACHVCGSFDHLKNDCNNWYNNGRFAKPVWTNVQRVNKQNFSKLTHPSPKWYMVLRTVLTRSDPIPVNAVRPVNTVNTVKGTRVNTTRPKAVLSAVKGNKGNAIKASASWGNPHQDLKDKGVINSGFFRHMTGNRSYLTDYEEIDGGFVAFGGNSKGGKITGIGKIRTGKLDFKDVYFVKELKFNLFSVSQMCDKKNSVLFTDTECVFLSPNFKLTDESHVLLKVPRKDNMYSVDLKNGIPQGGLTCLFAKATPDESNIWHRRLGHKTCLKLHETIDHLGKFDGKADEGFFVGYSTNSKAFRVFNSRTRIVEENLHVKFSEDTPNIAGSGPKWLFDIDALTKSMNYEPVVAGNQSNGSADLLFSKSSKDSPDAGFKPSGEEEKKDAEDLGNEDSEVPSTEELRVDQEKDQNVNNTNNINTVSSPVNAAGIENNVVDENIAYGCDDDPNMPNLEEIVHSDNDEGVGTEIDMTNLDKHILVSPILTTSIHKDHPVEQIIGDIHSAPQTRRTTKSVTDHARIEAIKLFLAYASFKDFIVYQMDVKSAFLYGKIEKEIYVCQPPGFENPEFPDIVYKVYKH